VDLALISLREREQQLISTSGTSVSALKEYDAKLKNLYDSEKALQRKLTI